MARDTPITAHPSSNIANCRFYALTRLISTQRWTWFSAISDSGHLIEHKEERHVLSKWGNDLRQSYRTLAQAAGASELDIHLLMNHSLPGVNAGYITRDSLLRDHLRKQQGASRRSSSTVRRARPRGRT
ncbi:hypothetical protein [Mesorhizobium sp. L-8-3]|uniref:hypothetical protein n=1 Tax=Mesorhizobium sp. L-8-3 TaxID=2744522 RepID=UPI0019352B9B|nr:hypothetical protein MesoLjLb_14850 [Mesorhizobium sp. L-8-3]